MNEGVVDGQSLQVECSICGGTEFRVLVTHSYDGPYVELNCVQEECGGGELCSVHISISQRLELI